MNTKSFWRLAAALAVVLITSSLAAAQDDFDPVLPPLPVVCPDHLLWAQVAADMDPDSFGPGRPGFGGHGPRGMKGQMKHLEQFRILKLLEFLDIQEDQETEFITLFREMRRNQRELDIQRRELLDSLSGQLKSDSTNDRAILDLVDRMSALQEQRQEAMSQFHGKIRKILTPHQFGRAIIFHERFEMQILEKLRGFHDRRGMERGMPRDSGWRPEGGRPGKDR